MADALDDFLSGKSSTIQPPKGAPATGDPLDAYLAGADAKPPPPPPDPDAGARLRAWSSGGPDVDQFGRVMVDPELGSEAGRAVVAAGPRAYAETKPILTPYAQDLVSKYLGPLAGDQIVNPLFRLAGGAWAGVNALGATLDRAAYETGNALGGPRLGADFSMGNQVVQALLPQVAGPRAGVMPPEAPPVNQGGPRLVQERMAPPSYQGQSPLDRVNQLILHDEQWTNPDAPGYQANNPLDTRFLPPRDAPPPPTPDFVPPGQNTAGPRVGKVPPAGANDVIPNGLTPEQVAEFRQIPESLPPMEGEIRTQEDAARRADQIIQHFASIGNKEPIPGATGALPTITQNSGLATLYRAVRDSDTPVPFTTLEDAAKAKAGATLSELVQTPEALDAAEKALDAKTAPMREKAFANKTEADPTPVVATIDHILASPSGMSDAVVTNLRKIRDKLVDKDGNILDRAKDPEQLYGLDKAIRKDLSPLAAGTTSDARLAAHEMMNVQDVLRPVIEGAAPGFKDYMATYSKDSRPLDEMRYLQSRNLTNTMDQTTLAKVDAMLKDIDKQRNAPGIKLPDSLSPETLEKLREVRDQMRRENFTATAGKALGSNTFQNLATNTRIGNIAGHVGNALLTTGTGAAIDLAAGGGGATGAVLGAAASGVMKGIAARQVAKAAAQQEVGRQMLMQELRDRLLNIDNKGVRSLQQP